MKLLCLSYDENITREVSEEAEVQHWAAICVQDREKAREAILDQNPDLVLLDVNSLADLDWWSEQGLLEGRPAMFMNAELSEEFVFKALECGVDGLVPKALFSRRFLTARVNAFLRRRQRSDARRVVARLGLVIDREKLQAEVKGKPLTLTPTEFKILRELATEDGQPVSRARIQAQVFGAERFSKRSLDVHICALRKKLKAMNLDITSARGVGYLLNPCAT